MFRRCCVPSCKNKRQDVKLHRFPIKKETRDKWLGSIGSDQLNKMGNVVNKVFVCHNHFEKRFVKESRRLRIGAYPTLFTEMEIASGIPSSVEPGCNKSGYISYEHSYAKLPHCDHTYCCSPEGINMTRNLTSCSDLHCSLEDAFENRSHMDPMCSAQLNENITPNKTTADVIETSKAILDTPKRYSKKRLIRDVKSLTPNCRLLYKEFKKASRLRDIKSRAKKALDFTKEKSFQMLTENMNPLAKKLLWMQIKLCTKMKSARRFSMEEKLIGLAVYKQSPKCYKFLQKIFILPSKTTLKAMIGSLNIDVGINPQIFELVKEEVKDWNDQKRLCTVIFDEMALEPAVNYLSHKDEIDGFVHINEKRGQFADQALVFMLRGAVHKWQQPIAFYFSEGQTKSSILKGIIKDIVAAVTDTGLRPIALVSDQGTSFQSALNELLEDTKRDQLRAGKNVDNTIHLCGNSINIVYDPPHLIKGMRNNLLSKDVLYEGKVATWQDIIDVYNMDCNHGESRIMHKLTDEHVIPEKIKKMKVKTCVRVFSKTVSAALSYTAQFPLYPDGSPVSATIKNTSEFISFMDDLFDSANGATIQETKDLRRAVTSQSKHHSFWTEATRKLADMRFITKDNKQKTVPSVKNWIVTLNSLKNIWKRLSTKENVKVMRPRYFNSDPIENFFGQVRAYNCRNNDPSASTFKNTFKSLIITRFINFHSESFNCENDRGMDMLYVQKLFQKQETQLESSSSSYDMPLTTKDVNVKDILVQARLERIHIHSKAYTAGWVSRKNLQKIKCRTCKNNLLTTEENNNIHEWIKCKEFNKNKRKLAYPTEYVVRGFGTIIKETNEFLEQNAHQKHLSYKIKKEIYKKYSFEYFNCKYHKELVTEYFVSFTIKMIIFNWCNTINRILKGVDIIRLARSSTKIQNMALLKYKKKLKNKKLNK